MPEMRLAAHLVTRFHYLHGLTLLEVCANYRDVAMIFHSHCLSPYLFFVDMNRRGEGLWSNGIAFPLERLYSLIASGVWSDSKSESMWMSTGKSPPYQLWDSDPATGGVLRLQDIRMTCPWCSSTQEIRLAEFTATHTTKTAMSRCASCSRQFNADTLSARYLKDDLLDFIEKQTSWSTLC